ncbi:MAG TPA: protein kinase [Vicinamibacterales bacterium]|nr:protein kinase [Vicinamibacterales bacterium]
MRCTGCDVSIESGTFCQDCLALLSSPTESGELNVPIGIAALRPRRVVPVRLSSGTFITDRYRIVRHLGSGGMGVVYQAEDLTLNVTVALKFLSSEDTGNHRRLQLFLNEVRLARQITHPNVCRIFDVGEVDGRHFISMEHVEGEDLASLLRRIGRFAQDKALSMAIEICRGLEAAHDRGILHGDLKPSNLMIDAHGRAKIMDFGLAKFHRHPNLRGEVAGTPDYMAPEQRRGESPSVQSELYGLGLVLYELFTGRRARRDFESTDSGEGPSSSTALEALDPIVERIIRHCLERDPGLRPSSVGAVSTALARLASPPWRPSEGVAIPHRSHWVLRRKLGQGGFGETWLAEHAKTHDARVFKFCTDAGKLKAFQREITLFRFMRETLGGRDDILALVDWQLDQPPYFIESEFSASVNLTEWFQKESLQAEVSRHDRVDVIRRTAVALAAAHSVGVLHKDVKPANVLVARDSGGAVRVRLCDFGISILTDETRLRSAGVTAVGLTAGPDAPSPDAGTRLYMAPEIIEGKAATTSADVYALGVMLYQISIGDFAKALAPGWDRDVDDDLLREDIAATVDGAPERRLTAAQIAERLRQRPERAAARDAELRGRERARAAAEAVRRRRNWATVVLGALLVLSIALGLAFERAESSAREMHLAQTLSSNEAMVRLAAAAVSDKLQGAVRRVEEEASNRSLRELLGRLASARNERSRAAAREALQRHVDQVLVGEQSRIQSWTVSDREGYLRARAPYDPAIIGQNYKYREWFNGRVELASDAQMTATPRAVTGFSLAFTSTAQNHPLVIGLASPIFAVNAAPPDGTIIGVLSAGIQLQTFNRWLEIAENPPDAAGCPDRFVLLLHRTQLIRHPCPDRRAAELPVNGFSGDPAVDSLLNAGGRKSASFRDPLRSANGAPAKPALAVAWSLETLPDWTLILEQDVDAALRPITALTRDFHGPAHLAFALGAAACVPLAALLWRRGRWRPSAEGNERSNNVK